MPSHKSEGYENIEKNQSWLNQVGFFALAILPNLYIINITESRIIRAYLYTVIAVILIFTLRKNIYSSWQAISLAKRLVCYFAGTLLLVSLVNTISDPIALLGDMIMPLGNITFIAALICGVLLAHCLPTRLTTKAIITGAWLAIGISITMMLAGTAGAGYRAEAFFDHSLAFALYLSVATLFSIDKLISDGENKPIYWSEPVIFIGFIGLSGSRVALLTTILFALSLLFFIQRKKYISKITIFISGIILVLVPSFLLFGRLHNINYAIESLNYRISLWQRGIEIILQNFWGVGYGNISRHFYSMDLPSWLLEPYHRRILVESSHNLWIDIGIGFGIPVALMAICLVVWILYRTIIGNKQNYIFGIAFILIIINLATIPATTITLVLLGILAGILIRPPIYDTIHLSYPWRQEGEQVEE